MSPSCRIFILLLAAAAMGKPTTWQQGESPLTGVSTVSEQDLLAQPPGSNWTSYNGDYSGRRYSSLHEINLNNVAHFAPHGSSIPGIPNGSKLRLWSSPESCTSLRRMTCTRSMPEPDVP